MVYIYIYLHICLIFMVNVGKYTSPMDPMGLNINTQLIAFLQESWKRRHFPLNPFVPGSINSHYFHIIGDKLINPIVGVYIPIIRIPSLKVGGFPSPKERDF